MGIEPVTPGSEPGWAARALRAALRYLLLLSAIAGVSAAAAYGVFEWRIKAEQVGTETQVQALRQELRQQQDELRDQVVRVEKAAEAARLLLSQNGATTSLDARLSEIDTIKLDLQKTRDEVETKLKSLEQSVVDQVAKQGKETAQALSLELRYKSLLIKAQGEVLLTQVHWAGGNRGLAKDELGLASLSLRQALDEAPERAKPAIKQVFDLAEQAKSALILEQSSARDALNLLWHRVSELLGPTRP